MCYNAVSDVPTTPRLEVVHVSRELSDAEIDHFVELHLAGKTPDQIAAITGRNHKPIRRVLKARGVLTDHRVRVLPIDELVRLFNGGASVNKLAERYGVSRNVIDRRLRGLGIEPRSRSEAERVKWAQMTERQRERQVRKAHTAARGRVVDETTLTAKAQSLEAKGVFGSDEERRLHDMLLTRGIETIPQMAVGPYNCDLGAPPVAVEVFGGGWHWTGRHLRRLGKRVDYLFNAAFHVLVIQTTQSFPLTDAMGDYVAAYIQQARVNPTVWREYRVVRRDGETIASARSDRDDRSLVPAFRVTRNALGQYVGVPD
jgi:hypothetical protein